MRVRFSGQLLDGFVLSLDDATDFTGKLLPLAHVPSGEPVLTPQVARLARAIADRYAGTMSDVLRLALPPRRATAEKRPTPTPDALPGPPDPAGFGRYQAGAALLSALAEGRPARAVWTALPGEDWPTRLVELCQAALSGRRGALVVVPDGKDLDRLAAAAGRLLPEHSYTVLRADDSPEKRYRQFLAASRGAAQVVLGTRAAMFAPVRDLGLVVVWDDGDDLHSDEHAPYPHARDVLVQRAYLDNCAAVVAGTARTAEAALLIESGWAHELVADRAVLRSAAPRVQALGDDFELARDPAARSARLPSLAHEAARRPWPRARRCWCRCRGGATSRRWPARGAGRRPGAPTAPGRWASRRDRARAAPGSRPAAGARARRPPSTARTATAPSCAPPWWGSRGPPRSWRGRSRARRCAPPAARPGCWRRCPAAPRSSSPPRAPSRSPTAATAPRCCWTPGRCSAGPTCGRGRRRCAGGSTRRRSCGPRRPAGRSSWRPTPRTPSSRRWCGGTPAGWPSASWPTGASWASRRSPGSRRCRDRRRRSPSSWRRCGQPEDADLLGPVPEPPRPGQDGERERYLVRVPRAEGAALAHALTEVQGVRSAKKVTEHVRVQLDPLDLV